MNIQTFQLKDLIGLEIDQGYCQVIIQRYVDFTGQDKIKINGKDILWSEYKK